MSEPQWDVFVSFLPLCPTLFFLPTHSFHPPPQLFTQSLWNDQIQTPCSRPFLCRKKRVCPSFAYALGMCCRNPKTFVIIGSMHSRKLHMHSYCSTIRGWRITGRVCGSKLLVMIIPSFFSFIFRHVDMFYSGKCS